ncbi:hypothetical protein CKA32_003087 [Geitlerinema sp. FC II]|nr:hypothetical protein CKA32_003087 [Geitlerinema sp. FC II]
MSRSMESIRSKNRSQNRSKNDIALESDRGSTSEGGRVNREKSG